MDVRCPKCGEPWEIDSIHDALAERHYAYKPWETDKKPDPHSLMNPRTGMFTDQKIYEKYFHDIYAEFRAVGCNLFNVKHSDTKAHPGISVILEVLGDDIDGAASELDTYSRELDEYAGVWDNGD